MANIEYHLTPSERFNLISGMLAGLRIGSKLSEADSLHTTLDPIGIGGLGKIGITANDVYLEENQVNIRVPVSTHDVDIKYSGFSLRFSYPNNLLKLNSIESSGFVELEGTVIGGGMGYTRGMLESPATTTTENILCYLDFTVLIPPATTNDFIEVVFETKSSGADNSYTSLTTWWYREEVGDYVFHTITPTVNKGFKIYSKEPKDVISSIGDSNFVPSVPSPSFCGLGISRLDSNGKGLLPIYCNYTPGSSIPDFAYNAFAFSMILGNGVNPRILFGGVHEGINSGSRLWVPNYSIKYYDESGEVSAGEPYLYADLTITGALIKRSTDSEGNVIIEYSEPIQGNATVGALFVNYIGFDVDTAIREEVFIYKSELYNYSVTSAVSDDVSITSLPVSSINGLIYYNTNPGSFGGSGGGLGGWGGGGGISGGGGIYSGGGGIIWVGSDGVFVPVELQPGYNDVEVFIPTISDKPIEDGFIEIVSPEGSYILIPGGFTWTVVAPPEYVPTLSEPFLMETYKFYELFDYDIETGPEPPQPPSFDVDSIIDFYALEDIYDSSIQTIEIRDDDISVNTWSFIDYYDTEITTLTLKFEDNLDTFSFNELYDIEFDS